MKILVLAPQPFYIERGTPIDVDLLVRALCERGEQVHLLTYPDGADRDYKGLHIHRVRAPNFCRPRRPGFSITKLLCDLVMFVQAWRLARRVRPEVIHAGEEAVFIAMCLRAVHRVPYVYDMDSSIAQQLVEQRPWLKPLARCFDAIEAKAIRGSIAAAPVCNALGDLARERGAARVVTLHDISQLKPHELNDRGVVAQKIGKRDSRPMMMYVGNLEPYQGVDLLLQSMQVALRTGAALDLVVAGGDEADIARYRGIAEVLGISACTHFIGPWPASRLGELLAEADILVAPRIRGINTPMKIFPYLHSGKAVLVTDLPTHTQILDDMVAMLAPAEPGGFGSAIAKLAGDAALRERLGRAGRAFAEREHTYKAHRRRVDELYDFVSLMISGEELPKQPRRREAMLEEVA